MRGEILRELKARMRKGLADGTFDQDLVDRQARHFQVEFGPDALSRLDGQALLHRMHARREDEPASLAYWLEYKSDDEFSSRLFGSISGGSAYKFGVLDKHDGRWLTGADKAIPADDAASLAREQRDELVAGCKVLERFEPRDAGDFWARELHAAIGDAAPSLSTDAWAHKYWQILYPDRLDPFHTAVMQRFHLLKLLELPPDEVGPLVQPKTSRFSCAGRFVQLARELGTSTTFLGRLLSERSPVHAYWRVGTTSGSTGESQWPVMQEQSWASIGWHQYVPDLSGMLTLEKRDLKDAIVHMLGGDYKDAGVRKRKAGEIVNFATEIAPGDTVLACEGATVVGVGRVTGAYEYREALVFPHVRNVEWLDAERWTMPVFEGRQTTVCQIGKSAVNVLTAEQHVQRRDRVQPNSSREQTISTIPATLSALDEWSIRVEASLKRKGQAILYGPPGTGKTFRALKLAHELAARHAFRKSFDQLAEEEREQVVASNGLVRVCTFHPNWGYEDFVEGVRPATTQGVISFHERDGLFKTLCDDAGKSDRLHILVIDEINRGDIPRIFGELLTVIEMDKRDQPITLPVSGRSLRVPKNVFVLGTMNTADRSISLLDAALRRRFSFVELMPDTRCLAGRHAAGIQLGPWLEALNERLRKHLKRNARNLQVGHAYLMPPSPITSLVEFGRVLRDDIIPLLEDYCYDDFHTLQAILGTELVDAEVGCIREALFGPSRQEDLRQALQFEEMDAYADEAEGEASEDDDDSGDIAEAP